MEGSVTVVRKDCQAEQAIIDNFHKLWYPRQLCQWQGVEMMKCPMDLFMYQEILWECKPDLIIECGTWHGGSALYLANLCDIMQHGNVFTIDIERLDGRPIHPRIAYIDGSSVDQNTFKLVSDFSAGYKKVMVILDSDHTEAHVLKELELYSTLVASGQYLIVEDTNIHGHPVRSYLPPGPWEAIEQWLPTQFNFTQDRRRERFLLTFNPGGYLKRN